jgi:hypothetical protein
MSEICGDMKKEKKKKTILINESKDTFTHCFSTLL